MDSRSIAFCISMKELSAKAIHQERVQTLGAEAVAHPTVTWHLRAATFPAQSKEAPDEAGVTRTDSVDAAVPTAPTDNPFSSARELSRLTCLSRSTVHRRLTESFGFTVRHLHWIPRRLSGDQKAIRVNLSRELLRVLQRQQTRGRHNILTRDESWFDLHTGYERIWLGTEQPVPDSELHMTQSPNSMFAVAWNHNGFRLVFALPKGLEFNAGYHAYTTEILKRINNWWKGQGAGSTRKLIVYADNARPHTTKLLMDFMHANRMPRVPHPPYSPDLAPSDFFLFGHVKRQLGGYSLDHADNLFTAVQEILDGSDKPTLIRFFEEWVRRLEQCIETEGEYVG
jgi:hypothetical protein